jgi:hypothetical protein
MPMQYVHINFWAVLVSAILAMAIEWAWYSPKAFGKFRDKMLKQEDEEGEDVIVPKKKEYDANYIISFVLIIISAYILSYVEFYADAATFYDGMSAAFYIWLGFVATTTLYGVIWEKRPIQLFLIENTYRLISFVLMGGILAAWR